MLVGLGVCAGLSAIACSGLSCDCGPVWACITSPSFEDDRPIAVGTHIYPAFLLHESCDDSGAHALLDGIFDALVPQAQATPDCAPIYTSPAEGRELMVASSDPDLLAAEYLEDRGVWRLEARAEGEAMISVSHEGEESAISQKFLVQMRPATVAILEVEERAPEPLYSSQARHLLTDHFVLLQGEGATALQGVFDLVGSGVRTQAIWDQIGDGRDPFTASAGALVGAGYHHEVCVVVPGERLALRPELPVGRGAAPLTLDLARRKDIDAVWLWHENSGGARGEVVRLEDGGVTATDGEHGPVHIALVVGDRPLRDDLATVAEIERLSGSCELEIWEPVGERESSLCEAPLADTAPRLRWSGLKQGCRHRISLPEARGGQGLEVEIEHDHFTLQTVPPPPPWPPMTMPDMGAADVDASMVDAAASMDMPDAADHPDMP